MEFTFMNFSEKNPLKDWVNKNQELIGKIVSITLEDGIYTIWYWGNI